MKSGQKSQSQWWCAPTAALILFASGGIAPVSAQQADPQAAPPAPAGPGTPPARRSIDFQLPPANEGRDPRVQGPMDNGLPPLAPGERRGAPPPVTTAAPDRSPPPSQSATPAPAANDRPAPSVAAPRRSPAPPPATRAAATNDAPPPAPDAPSDAPLANGAADTVIPTAPAAPAFPSTDSAAAAPPAAGPGDDTPLWAWLLAGLAALGAGLWYWRRRATGAVVDAPPPLAPQAARAATPAPAPAAPRPPAPAAPRGAAAPAQTAVPKATAASPLVTRVDDTPRARVEMALDVRAIRVTPDQFAVAIALDLTNAGAMTATGLMVRVALNHGSAMQEGVLARFFDGAGGSILRDDITLVAGAAEQLSTEIMLPRAAIEPLMIGGKPVLVPVLAFDVTYHWDGPGEAFGQIANSYVLGRAPAPGAGERLAPLPLDRASHMVDRPAARVTAIGRRQ